VRRTGVFGRALTGVVAAVIGTTALATMAAGPAAAAPPKPVGLVPTPTASSISLDWADVSAPDLAGYRVYRDGQLLTPATLPASSYDDPTAALGIVYAYGVTAVDLLGGESDPAIEFAKRPSIPIALFNVSAPPPPTLPAIVTFTDQSSGEPTAWTWDFQSDGVVDATTQNPTFTYTTSGTYTVTLIVSNVSGTDVETKTVVAGSVNDFTAPPKPTGLVPTSTASAISLDWADVSAPDLAGYRVYRDGQLLTPALVLGSSYVDPTAALGIVYAYGVTAVDVWGNASDPAIVFAKRPLIPFAAFLVSAPPPPTLPATVTFRDLSSGEPTAWTWDFQSDGVVDAATQNPTFTYTSSGIYAVTLTVSNVSGTDSETKTVVVGSVNDFTAPPKPTGLVPTPTVSGISLDWADVSAPDLAGYRVYRDGQLITTATVVSSSYADPDAVLGIVHAYGVTAVDVWGNASNPAIVFAKRPSIPVAGFLVSPATTPPAGAAVTFTDASFGEPTTWAWDFQSDGAIDATSQNATFSYPSPGTYAVTLTVSNLSGTDDHVGTVVVSTGIGGGPGGPVGPGDPGVVCGSDGPWAVGMPAVGPTTFHPVTPGRILDTRDGTGAPAGKLDSGCTLALDVTGVLGVPADGVLAVSLNITATEASENGYVTVYACAAGRPATSSLNTRPDRDIANLVTVPVGTDGLVCFYTYRSVHLLADVAGWFAGDGGSRMTGLAPARVLDTRDGTGAPAVPVAAGGVVSVQVAGWGGVPATGVSAVVLNLTTTESAGPGYLSAYPCDQDVYASALNYVAGQTVANHVLVPLDSAGRFCVSSYAVSDVIADVLGYYGAPGALEGSRFTPLTSSRIVDTRSDLPAGATRLAAANVLPVVTLGNGGVPSAGVDAVMFNVTSADAAGPGYLTAFPCGGAPPNASNVNHVASAAASNLVTVPLGAGGQVCIFSYADSHVLVDVAGYFSP
jgi:PKD repeat protein